MDEMDRRQELRTTLFCVRVACAMWVVWAVLTLGMLGYVASRPPDAVRALDYLPQARQRVLEEQRRMLESWGRTPRASTRQSR
jgi:hypothetical protein